MSLCKRFGFEKIQEIQTLLFHRFNPSFHTQICVITPAEKIHGMRDTLDQFYKVYDAYHTEGLSEQGYFLGYRMDGKWVAIARIMRHWWDVECLPEYYSFLRKWRIDRLPYLRQLILDAYSTLYQLTIFGLSRDMKNVLNKLWNMP